MKTSNLLFIITLFFFSSGCYKEVTFPVGKETFLSPGSGKGNSSAIEKSLFSSNSNYIAFFEEYKEAFINFHDSKIQNEGLSALRTSLSAFNNCFNTLNPDMDCFSSISNLEDEAAVDDFFDIITTHLSALRGNYSTLSDTEFSETLELTIEASIRAHYTSNPLTALLTIEEEENPPSEVPICYQAYADAVMDATVQCGITMAGCMFTGPGLVPCAAAASVIYSYQLYDAVSDFDSCMCGNYSYGC